jgi:hypothetical protein
MPSVVLPVQFHQIALLLRAPTDWHRAGGLRGSIDDLVVDKPGIFSTVRSILDVLLPHHPNGVATFLTAWITSVTVGSPASKSTGWTIGIANQSSGTSYPLNAQQIREPLAIQPRQARQPSGSSIQGKYLFSIAAGPSPNLLDSDVAFSLAERNGGRIHRTAGDWLESAVLTTEPMSGRRLWGFRYANEEDAATWVVLLDAETGETVWSTD